MRYLGAIGGTARFASEDVEYRGVLFPKDTAVSTSFVAANRDEHVFADPTTLDITRESASPHLTFGSGIHYCLGAWLARAELQEALPILARRLPDLAARRPDRVEAEHGRHLGPGPPAADVHALTLMRDDAHPAIIASVRAGGSPSLGRVTDVVRVGVLGCGNVGAALVGLVAEQADAIEARTGLRLEIAAVAVRNLSRERDVELPEGVLTRDSAAVVADPDIDVVVEVIGGIEPARELILAALAARQAGRHRQQGAARQRRRRAVRRRRRGQPGPPVRGGRGRRHPDRPGAAREPRGASPSGGCMGIVNGTTNYILTKMTRGGRRLRRRPRPRPSASGYAERDPTADVEGFDAGAKAAIIAAIAFGVAGRRRRRLPRGHQPHHARRHRRRPPPRLRRQAARHRRAGRRPTTAMSVAVRVHPAMVPERPPAGQRPRQLQRRVRRGRRRRQPHVLRARRRRPARRPAPCSATSSTPPSTSARAPTARWARSRGHAMRPIDETSAEYYLPLEVVDRPGVLHAVTGVFAKHGVSIRSMEQEGLGDDARLVFITHEAREADVQATLRDLRDLEVVKRVGGAPASRRRDVRYVSTRGAAPELGFADVLLAGLAVDGGLYVPERVAGAAGRCAATRRYADAAAAVMAPFVDGDDRRGHARGASCDDAYATFRHPAGVPARADRRRRLAARAVPRPDARLQGRRPAARRPAVRPRPRPAGRARHDRRGHVGRHRLGRHRRRRRPATTSTSSCSTPRAGSATCSAGR